jgi:hypothetical protein
LMPWPSCSPQALLITFAADVGSTCRSKMYIDCGKNQRDLTWPTRIDNDLTNHRCLFFHMR